MICEIQETPVYYTTRGAGFPLVILHGFLLDHEIMLGAFEPLFEERDGFQRIYVDMPGMGRTPAREELCSSAAIIGLMSQFVTKVVGERPFALAGFSYGGYIARGILKQLQPQVRGLCLIAPSVNSGPQTRELPEPRVIYADPGAAALLPEELRPLILSTLAVQSRPVIERIVQEFLAAFPRGDQAFLTRLRATPGFSYAPDIDQLDHPFAEPTLILTGRHDTSVGYADAFQLARGYPRATYAALDRAGHGVYLEQDRLYTALMHEWLDRIEESLNQPKEALPA